MPDPGTPLRILTVEDSADDAGLLLRKLRQSGDESVWERVETADAMRVALAQKPWDVILSDYVVPGFGGMEALQIAKESGLELPFVIVSGTVGEETLVEAMKAGAGAFVLKVCLGRLDAALKRELADAAHRRLLREAGLVAAQQ